MQLYTCLVGMCINEQMFYERNSAPRFFAYTFGYLTIRFTICELYTQDEKKQEDNARVSWGLTPSSKLKELFRASIDK